MPVLDLLILHGTGLAWDEIVCLVVPATVCLGFLLVVLRAGQRDDARAFPSPRSQRRRRRVSATTRAALPGNDQPAE